MAAAGIEIGAHAYSHADLGMMTDPGLLRYQVVAAKEELQDVLGRGGMGVVYRATDHLTGDTVVLKHVTAAPADLMFGSRGTDDSNLAQARK